MKIFIYVIFVRYNLTLSPKEEFCYKSTSWQLPYSLNDELQKLTPQPLTKMATLIAEMNTEEMDLPGTHIREINHSKMAQSWLQFCDEIQLTCCLSQKKKSYFSPALPLFVPLDTKKMGRIRSQQQGKTSARYVCMRCSIFFSQHFLPHLPFSYGLHILRYWFLMKCT